jgi:hypothetical protein
MMVNYLTIVAAFRSRMTADVVFPTPPVLLARASVFMVETGSP